MYIWPHTPAWSHSFLPAYLFHSLTHKCTHKPYTRASQYGFMPCWVGTGSAVKAWVAKKEKSVIREREWTCLRWLAGRGTGPSSLLEINSHSCIQSMCYCSWNTNPAHRQVFKCCPESSNFPSEDPCWKITGIRVTRGLFTPHNLPQQPKVFRVSLQWLTNHMKPYFRDHLDQSVER